MGIRIIKKYMDIQEVIQYLSDRLDEIQAKEPYARNQISAYQVVIQDLNNEG